MIRNVLGCVLAVLAVILWLAQGGWTQTKPPRSEIKLVVRADDIGSCHAANLACIQCFQKGIARSVEVALGRGM